ncbi:hypothetical protein [Kineosporia babensis]|uniref:CU044_5270 family protein n=1 Tax=Kineosporia babensis TaxID=499548 RepID=A0A9X1NA09_9ACTN|nr:hypothetical protein [Kineosporia babensis]MCD5311122.1 hypothetical protein [Kineosporia babensis]
MADEMDLLTWALSEGPDHDGHDQARARLREHMARTTEPTPSRAPRARRRSGIIGFGAGLGTLAAGAVAVFVIASAMSPDAVEPTPQASAEAGQPVIESELIALATQVRTLDPMDEGDATLIARTQKIDGKLDSFGYDLYADNGAYYYRVKRSDLPEAVAQNDDVSEGTNAKGVKAARGAVDGDLEASRIEMTNVTPNPWGLGKSEEEQQRLWDEAGADFEARLKESPALAEHYKGYERPTEPPKGKELEASVDNSVWMNATDALTAGAGDPQVRAGVLRVLSTIHDVTVEETTTKGRATLTLNFGMSVFDDDSSQKLVVDAETAMPISSVVKSGDATSVTTYKVSRVTLADLAAKA